MPKQDPFDSDFFFDMSNQTEEGYLRLPVGKYKAKVVGWDVRKKDNGDISHWIDFEITEGDFEGEMVRDFETIKKDKVRTSMQYFTQTIRNLNLVRDPEDRNAEGKLGFTLEYGPPKDNGARDVVGVKVNNEVREVLGREGILVIGHYEDNAGKKQHSVNGVEHIEEFDPDESFDNDDIDWPT